MIKKYIFLSLLSFLTAIILFALCNEWIIITIPSSHNNIHTTPTIINKKEVVLSYFHREKWNKEKAELLWSESITKNARQLISAWLNLLDEEHVITKKITLQDALISTSGTLYISFDQYPLKKDDTIFNKWMFIEGLLKTLRDNNICAHNVHFLVQHQPLNDQHIDFSLPWPLQGFL